MSGAWVPDNNWVWFRAVVAAFSRTSGGSWDRADIEHAVARTEDWYAGDGWYADGGPRPGEYRNFDLYSGWAMQLYPLCQGRSLTYRFAALAPFWAGALFDATPLAPG